MANFGVFWSDLINPFATPQTTSATVYRINNSDGLTSTVFTGTGFTYDGQGHPTAGTITSVTLVRSTTGQALQTITNVSTSLDTIGTFIHGVAETRPLLTWFAQINQDAEPDIISATQIRIPNSDGTYTNIVGASLAVGSPPTGNVTAIQHLNTDGVSVLTSVAVTQTLDVSAGAIFTGEASSRVFELISIGNNTITHNANFTVGADSYFPIMEDGVGNDTFVGAGVNGGEVNFGNSDDPVTINLLTGTASSTSFGTNTLTNLRTAAASDNNDTLTAGNTSFGAGTIGSGLFTSTMGYNLFGLDGADTITGGTQSDALYGDFNPLSQGDDQTVGGDDIINGLGGVDFLWGGAGNDTVNGGDGNDVVQDFLGNDVLTGGNGIDFLAYLYATAGVTVSLNTVAQQNTVGAGLDTISGFENLGGSNFNDNLTGDSGDNIIVGNLGADTMTGLGGNDTYFVDNAGDSVVEAGGGGNDTVRTNLSVYIAPANVENIVYTGTGTFTVVAGPTAIGLTGGASADTLIGSTAGGTLDGGDGNDVLWFHGATTLTGGLGFDYAIQLDGAGQTRSIGGAGVEVYVANSGNDTIDSAGATVTTILYAGAGGDAVTQSAVGGYAFGQDGNDSLFGGDGQDIFLGGAGFDNIMGFGGNDVLYIDSADGIAFDGGAGVDYAIVDSAAAVSVDLSARNVEVFIGNIGNDIINAGGAGGPMGLYGFGGDDVMTSGASGGNQMFGQDGNDTLNSGAGGDVVIGGDGNDQLFGNAGDDLILGEVGDDLIVGGAGLDTLWGGAGNDTFRIAAADIGAGLDVIADFGDTSGDNDVLNFVGLTSSQVTITTANGGALLTIAGGYSLFVVGATAASIQDDLLFS